VANVQADKVRFDQSPSANADRLGRVGAPARGPEHVAVRREEVRVEREPITAANIDRATDGPAISEAEHEVVLHEEEVVTEKRIVPKERVRLAKDVVTDQQVSDQVRKERIDIDTGHD
jgi:uncharacterized protein (TIGR02271 family)